MVVRRDVFEQLGGFCAAAKSAFDWEMWTRIAVHHPIYYVPEVLVGVGRDDTAESSRLMRSGEQVTDAMAAIETAAHHLPPDRAAILSQKARDRMAEYGLDIARQYLKKGDLSATMANLHAALEGQPSPETRRLAIEVLQGVDHAFRG